MLDAEFAISALNEAIESYGIGAIFKTDQGSQFTADAFTNVLRKCEIRISMDGKGRALDNIYILRLWRLLKYQDIYLNDYDYSLMEELNSWLKRYFNF